MEPNSVFSIDVENNGGETTDIVKIDANFGRKDMNNVEGLQYQWSFGLLGLHQRLEQRPLHCEWEKKYVVKVIGEE